MCPIAHSEGRIEIRACQTQLVYTWHARDFDSPIGKSEGSIESLDVAFAFASHGHSNIS